MPKTITRPGSINVTINGEQEIWKAAEVDVQTYFKPYNLVVEENGRFYPSDYGAEGFLSVTVNVPEIPADVVEFIEGDDTLEYLGIGDEVSRVNANLGQYPNLHTVYVENYQTVIPFANNVFDGTKVLTEGKIIVAAELLSGYLEQHSTWPFQTFEAVADFEYPVLGETLNISIASFVQGILGTTGAVVEELTITDDYSSFVLGALDIVFETFPNMDTLTSRWLNGPTYALECEIPFVDNDTLTIEYVQDFCNRIGVTVGTKIVKVIVPPEFVTFEEGVFDYIFLRFQNCEKINYGILPDGYQEVEYIESTGTQYIDSEVTADAKINIVFDYQFTGIVSGKSYPSLISVGLDNTNKFNAPYMNSATILQIQLASDGSAWSAELNTPGNGYQRAIYEINYEQGNIYHQFNNGNKAYITAPTATFYQISGTILLLSSSFYVNGETAAKVYSIKIKKNSAIIRSFVPCYRIVDGEIGLYDTVNKQFYSNAGTGVFLKGNDIIRYVERPEQIPCYIYHNENTSHTLTSEIVQDTLTRFPEYETCETVIADEWFTSFETGVFDYIFFKFQNCEEIEYYAPRLSGEYQEVEYIGSSSTQYIDSAFKPNQDTKVEMSITNSSVGAYWYGTWNVNYNVGAFAFCNDNSHLYLAYANQNAGGEYSQIDSSSHTIGQDKNFVYLDGNLLHSFNYEQFEGLYSLSLFGQNRSGSVQCGGPFQLERAKIYDDGTLVRDFIPCYRLSDNIIGLYDIVGNQFYTNQGTGTFLKGNDNTTLVPHPLDRPALSTCRIYHDENTSHTLTAQIVQDTLTRFPEYASCEKVIVDEWFTEYESGSINAIISAFTSLEALTTTYEAGVLDLDMNGYVVNKIAEIGKTLDAGLAKARHIASTWTKPSDTYGLFRDDLDLTIIPPLDWNHTRLRPASTSTSLPFVGSTNIVYVAPIVSARSFNDGSANRKLETEWLRNCYVEEIEITLYGNLGSCQFLFQNISNLKKIRFDQTNGSPIITWPDNAYAFSTLPNLEHLSLLNWTTGIDISSSTKLTRQALIDLFNSLGTPATQQTLTIGATNLAKLTEADKQIATAKNWTLA